MKVLGSVAATASVSPTALAEKTTIALAVDPADRIAAAKPTAWAIEQLTQTLQARGISVTRVAKLQDAVAGSLCIAASGAESAMARRMLSDAGVSVAAVPEALGLVTTHVEGRKTLLACGHDVRGLAYALTELAEVVQNAHDATAAIAALAAVEPLSERPANEVRSMMRSFCSDVEDKPWYNDRTMWPAYFDTLAKQRFNRFNLAFGIGYDFIRHVTDAYFEFTYPFLLKVPGYNVRVPQLPDAERDRNLETLRYISEECVLRGLEFHVGLWMHGYEWIDSPNANYTIEGLDKTTHGPYCRDAVRMLLKEVPNISGLTFRIHGESGVQEGSFEFWKTVFDGVATCGRRVAIDMHPKGMSEQMTEIALATKQPVSMSPKFWGEHMGMTYHQADIRKLEKPRAENKTGLMALSDGTRSFLRYGYGDLLREDRKWSVVHRIWPGTQRILLWGDPVFAAGYSRAFSFCGSSGVEIMEPLTFKGRRGSGIAGSRCGYADASYNPRWDWEKFEYSTRLWGRLLYNPETNPQVWRRSLQKQFGPGAIAMESALASVSRILPTITTAYAPSAANNLYWPEVYCNQSMVNAKDYEPYSDALAPRVFGNASPFDPALFLSANEYAEELLNRNSSGKYTPVEVAQWIEDAAAAGRAAWAQAEATASGRDSAAYRRMKIDIEIQAGLGEFFGAKFRSGVLFHLYELTHERAPLEAAIAHYKKARAAWASLAEAGRGVYVEDITVGEQPYLRGHWMDRLPAIDRDIAALSALLDDNLTKQISPKVEAAMRIAQRPPQRTSPAIHHTSPMRFKQGGALRLVLSGPGSITNVEVHYRHLNQAENYISIAMEKQGAEYAASIPAPYTTTNFPLEYFFSVTTSDGKTSLYPGFTPQRTNQPYFVVRSV